MKFFTSSRREAAQRADAAEAAQRQQQAEYKAALTQIIGQTPGWREPPPADEAREDAR